jgi:hypothetical protein
VANHGHGTLSVTAASTAIEWAGDLSQMGPVMGDGKDTGFDVVWWLKLCLVTQNAMKPATFSVPKRKLRSSLRLGENKILELNITSTTIPRTTTMGVKRPHAAMDAQDSTANQSPFMPMFEGFRAELDEHHDRRERIIKSSRDITASSKKM